ncbi:MAG: PxKF domain-containing protein [Candidatus Limnocylindrales bacterium]
MSATAGTGDETVVVNTWNNTGDYYIRVVGHQGASDPNAQFSLDVTKTTTSCSGVTDNVLTARANEPDSGVETVILTDSSKLALGDTSPGTLRSKLTTFAGRAEVGGVVIDVATDPRVTALKAQAAANTTCPYAQNLVAEELKGIVDSYRANNAGLRYVVLAGGDDVIPFFRYPDQSLLGQESGYVPPVEANSASEASLRRDFVLSQDAYGSGIQISLRTSDYPVPGLAVGRLVETPSEVAGMLDAYTAANGVVSPGSSLVTGYDFLADAADAVRVELEAGTGATSDTLITPNGKSPQDPASWTATQLSTKLLGSRHDAIFLAGHFSANSALAADFQTSLLTTDLAASTVNLENSIVFSAGCHSGYNLVDGDALTGVTQPLDWSQAFAQKRATLVAGTGYQYGDTDFLEYSERLYRDFARELRAGTGSVAIGEALVRAKIRYLATTPDIRGIHEKALLEATLFGLPMLGVNMPAGRGGTSGTGSPISTTAVPPINGTDLGLSTANLSLSPSLTPRSIDLVKAPYTDLSQKVTARWLEGPNGVVTNPAEPALPLQAVNATSTNAAQVLRGVGFRGGSFTDTAGIVPLTGAPTTELRGVHAPFVSPVFYPMKLWSPNYFGALGTNGGTNLLVTPVQHRTDDATLGTSVQRRYTGLDLKLFYSSNLTDAALSDAPTIVDVAAQRTGSDIAFTAQVIGDPAAAIHSVWVTWTGKTGTASGNGSWASVDLTQCVAPLPAECGTTNDSRIWKGVLAAAPTDVRYVVQAANGIGLVAFDDNRGSYFTPTADGAPIERAATDLQLISPPTSGTFGDNPTITAELTSDGSPLAGKVVSISIGGTGSVGVTGANGRVAIPVALNSIPGATQIVASFARDESFEGSGDTASFSIAQAPSALSPFAPFVVKTTSTNSGVATTLTATVGGKVQALMQQTVTIVLTGPVNRTVSTITDYLGQVVLPRDLPDGTYAITATFAGDVTFTGVSRTGTLIVAPFTGFFAPVDDAPFVNEAKAGSGIPVKFSLGGNRGLSIFASGYPKATRIACVAGDPVAPVEETTTSASGLTYDASSNQYKYTWKTPKSYAGSCYRLDVRFSDGTTFIANFRFK